MDRPAIPDRCRVLDATDNDGDSFTDWPKDPDCANPDDPSERPPPPPVVTH